MELEVVLKPRLLIAAGFTGYESRILHVLLEEGYINAREISEKTEMPLSKVYQTTKNLKEKSNFLTEKDERPKKFGVDLGNLYSYVRRTRPEIGDFILKFYRDVPKVDLVSTFQEFKGLYSVREKLLDMYDAAKDVIKIITWTAEHFETANIYLSYRDATDTHFKDAIKRGVKINILLPSEEIIFSKVDFFNIKYRKAFLEDISENPNEIEIRFLDRRIKDHSERIWLHGYMIDPIITKEEFTGAAMYGYGERDWTPEIPYAFTKEPMVVTTLNILFESLWDNYSKPEF